METDYMMDGYNRLQARARKERIARMRFIKQQKRKARNKRIAVDTVKLVAEVVLVTTTIGFWSSLGQAMFLAYLN